MRGSIDPGLFPLSQVTMYGWVSSPASLLEPVPNLTCLQSRPPCLSSHDISYLQSMTGQIPLVDESDSEGL